MRPLHVLIATASSALLLAACGSESVSVPEEDAAAYAGAEIFATHCAGCHTLSAAGTQGSGNRATRVQGPNFDQRVESYDDVLFAIRNGGFSGAIMPQNIVVGDEADLLAEFLAEYSGGDVVVAPRPSAAPESETGEDTAEQDAAATPPVESPPENGDGGQTQGAASSGSGGEKPSSGSGSSYGNK